MKMFAGYAGACALVGLAAFSLQDRVEPVTEPTSSQESEQSDAVTESPVVSTRAPSPAATMSEPEPQASALAATEPVSQATQADQSRQQAANSNRRRGRRGSRSRGFSDQPLLPPENWAPPEGPVRIALQAGHWRADEAPPELSGLRDNGTSGGGQPEWAVNLAIARSAAAMLEDLGYVVDVLPAVVPPAYRAHLFVSIHADGSEDPNATGYRVAAPRADATGRAAGMVALLERSYGQVTGLRKLPTVTRRMQNYYAFNARRYEHALHPYTIAVILETGFLTSASDREIIMNDPDRAARGIVEAIKAFPETPPPVQQSTGSNGSR